MSLGSKIIHGAFWASTGSVCSRLLAMVTAAVLARILGRELFGDYGVVTQAVLVLSMLVGAPIGNMAARQVSLWVDSDKDRCGRVLVLTWAAAGVAGFLMVLGLFAASGWLGGVLGANSDSELTLKRALMLVSPYLLFGVIMHAGIGVMTGYQAYRESAIYQTLTAAVTLVLSVSLAWRYGLWGAVIGLITSAVLGGVWRIVISYRIGKARDVVPRGSDLSDVSGLLVTFVLPAFLADIVIGPGHWVGSALLRRTADGASEMGVFHAANYLRTMAVFIPGALGPVMLPLLVKALHRDDQGSGDGEAFSRVATLHTRLAGLVGFPVAIGMVGASRAIMRIVFGQEFSDGWSVLACVACAAGFQAIGFALLQVMASHARMWVSWTVNMISFTLFISVAWLTVDQYGAVGLAVAHASMYILNTLSMLYIRGRVFGARVHVREMAMFVTALCIGPAAGLCAWQLTPWLGMLIGLLLAGLTMGGLLLVAFDSDERKVAVRLVGERIPLGRLVSRQ